MNLSYDLIIVGGGLAGACAALSLSRSRSVLLLESERPASGASGVAAGLVNPIMSQRAKPVWRMSEALDALSGILELADASSLFHKDGILRPATSVEQAHTFEQAATRLKEEVEWLSGTDVATHWPTILAPHGALRVRNGGAIAVPDMVRSLFDATIRNGACIETNTPVLSWDEGPSGAWVDVAGRIGNERLYASHVLLAVGASWKRHSELSLLRLHNVKGQSVRVRRLPERSTSCIPYLAGSGYVVPIEDSLIIGSSYEHEFSSLEPDPVQTKLILQKASQMLPDVSTATIVEEMAGVRVNVPGTRLPMVGPLPGRSRIWTFTGLGSKGLLMAPLLGLELPSYLDSPGRIPAEIRVRVHK